MYLKRFLKLKPDGEGGAGGGAVAPTAAEIDAKFDAVDLELDDGGTGAEGTGSQSSGDADRAAEQTALSKGWTPRDKFKGDPAKWVDAKTFVERGERFASNLKNENAALKQQLAEFKGTAEAFRKYHADVMEGKQKEIDTAIKQLTREGKEADADRDFDTAEAIESRIELLRAQKAKLQGEAATVAAPAAPTIDPVLREWIDEDNKWFETDPKLRAYSIELGQTLRKENPNLLGRPFLDRVREIMEEDFPTKFQPAQRRSMADGSSGRSSLGSGSGKSIRDLPKADRDLCRQFVKEGWVKEDDFVKSYFARQQ